MTEIKRKIELLKELDHTDELSIEFLERFNPYENRNSQSIKRLITELETHDLLCLDLKNTLINLIMRCGNYKQVQELYFHLNADIDEYEFSDDYEFKEVFLKIRSKA